MKKWSLACLSMLCAITVVASAAADGGKKASRGLFADESTTHAASHVIALGGDGSNAGAIASAYGKVEGLGKVTVDTSSSWDWSFYTPEHRCALVNTTSQGFAVNLAGVPGPWTADATVAITDKHGETIDGVIVGGSVCELAWIISGPTTVPPGSPGAVIGTINEGLASFEITGGTGRFAGATGSGLLRSVFNSVTLEFEADEMFLHLSLVDSDSDSDSDSD